MAPHCCFLSRLHLPASGPRKTDARSLLRPKANQSPLLQVELLQGISSLALGGPRPALLTDYFDEGVGDLRKRLVVYERFFVLFYHPFGAHLKGQNRHIGLGDERAARSDPVRKYLFSWGRLDGH